MFVKHLNLISIIVPVYKVEAYLDKCIESIVKQSYKSIEIIIVDDGSPDRCPIICDDWSRKDDRIRVIHKKNGGLSDARNYGIEEAAGEFIMFVDSDDYISEDMCEQLIEIAQHDKVDIVSGNFFKVQENGKIEKNDMSIGCKQKKYSNIELLQHYFTVGSVDLEVVWNKLYRRNIFFSQDRVRFPFGRLHEDCFTTYQLYFNARSITVIDKPLYYYLQRGNSIMGSYGERNLKDRIDCAKEYIPWAERKCPYLKSMMEFVVLKCYLEIIIQCRRNRNIDSNGTMIKNFGSYIKCNLVDIGDNKYITTKYRVKYVLSKFHLFGFLMICLDKINVVKGKIHNMEIRI